MLGIIVLVNAFAKINIFFHSVIANGFFFELIFYSNQVTFAAIICESTLCSFVHSFVTLVVKNFNTKATKGFTNVSK